MAVGMASKLCSRLKTRLPNVVAISLCALAAIGIVLRSRDGVAALSWGWQDLVISTTTSAFKHGQGVNYGVFDSHKQFSEAKGLAIEHIFVSWLSSDASDQISSSFIYARDRNRWLMITIEPHELPGRKPQLLEDIREGAYDSTITPLCRSIGSLQVPVFVRWGHEMETGDMRYPWSGANSDSYIAAYSHFATRCRAAAPTIYLVWSPSGKDGLAKYYPGEAYVDYVGLSVYSLLAYDLDNFGRARNFKDIFTPEYNRVTAFDRPVMIAEMGVSGEAKYQAHWMADFFRSLQNFPLLRTVVYFNRQDTPGAWPQKYGIPNWTIDPNTFE